MVGYKQYFHFVWLFALAMGLVAPVFARVETAEGKHFDIVGLDRPSVYFVEELSERVLIEAERYLGEQPAFFPQRILVTLRPEGASAEAKNYRILIEPGGFVRLDFNWRKDLTYIDLCRGMVDAYLARYAIFHHGYEAPEKIKAWVVSALSHQMYLSLRPSVYLKWMEFLQDGEHPFFPSLTKTIKDARFDESSFSPYLLILAMRNAGFLRETVHRLCRSGVAGIDVLNHLTSQIQPSNPNLGPVTLNDWWEDQMAQLIAKSAIRFDSLKASNERIKSLSKLDEFIELGIKVKNLRGLWQFRSEENVREIIVMRLGQIMAYFGRVNPAYLNSAQSLGRLYEQLLIGNEEHAYVFDLASFLGDFSDAQQLHEDIDAALSEVPIN